MKINLIRTAMVLTIAIASIFMPSKIVFALALAPPSLEKTRVPPVGDIAKFVERTDKAVILGKALFWDSQVGSDGQACASCHFHAGADPRLKNQLSPGLRREPNPDTTFFQRVAPGGAGGPNYTLTVDDFPFHKLTDPNNRNSAVTFSSNDVASSQGTFGGEFIGVPELTQGQDICDRIPDPVFHVGGIGTQRVEPRNTPTTINAVFNFRNFWDGRANNIFNGVDEFGLRSPNATVLRKTATGVIAEKISLNNASLASQAVGPPRSDLEMACTSRAFAQLGRKLLPRRALAMQKVHATDGVLGVEMATTGVGLKKTYNELVKLAFKKEYWNTLDSFDGYSQMEANFSLFFGLAVQLYEATLISDKTPYDAFTDLAAQPFDPAKGKQAKLSPEQRRGLDVFLGKGNCIACHHGALFSAAAAQPVTPVPDNLFIERMLMGDGGVALYDVGFYNIGVTPTNEDIGIGGKDPFGNPLSFSEQLVTNNRVDRFDFNPCAFEVPFNAADCNQVPANLSGERIAVRGAFKVPTLRNVALTGPYMHNGSMATLEQVVEFYNRGGNFQNPELDAEIKPLGLTAQEKSDLVAFLHSLTDQRVVNESKPFDHPQLFVSNGHPGNEFIVDDVNGDGFADSHLVEIPAVGDRGLPGIGRQGLKPFLLANIESPVINACLAGKPNALVFAYTGQPCTATTNFQGGSATCTGSPNEAQPIQVVMTKDAAAIIPNPPTQTIQIGDLVTIAKTDGKDLPKDIKMDIRKDGVTLQSLSIKTDCTKPIYENDRFGSLLLENYLSQ